MTDSNHTSGQPDRKQVLLVGALGGLGHPTVIRLVGEGWTVYAADVSMEVFDRFKSVDHVIPLQVDIANEDAVEKAFETVSKQTSGLDAIINMAGILVIGSMIELPLPQVMKAFEINLWGVYHVNKRFFPLLLKRKGRVINLSSEVGTQMAAPFNGTYAMTKHALEAYSDALRRELAFLDIKVIKIQPGPFKTDMTRHGEQLFREAHEQSKYFKQNLEAGIKFLPKVYAEAHDPKYVVGAIVHALQTPNPKIAYAVRRDFSRRVLDWLPVRWADALLKKMLS